VKQSEPVERAYWMIRNDHYLAGVRDPHSLRLSNPKLEIEESNCRCNKIKPFAFWVFAIKLFETSLKKQKAQGTAGNTRKCCMTTGEFRKVPLHNVLKVKHALLRLVMSQI
jgi:hypothetical protein